MLAILLAATASAGQRYAGSPILLRVEDLPIPVEAEALQRQFTVLSSMPEAEVLYSAYGPVESIRGNTGLVLPVSVRELEEGSSADALLETFSSMLLATGSEILTVRENRFSPPKERIIVADESIGDIPVVDGLIAVAFDDQTGVVSTLWASFLMDCNLPTKSELTAAQSWQAVVRALEASGDAVQRTVREVEKPTLAYLGIQPDSQRPQLVWATHVGFECPTGRHDAETVWIDAIDSSVAGRRSMITYAAWPDPCQHDELKQADCQVEPDPTIGDAPYTSSCAGASTRPRLIVKRMGCSSSFRITWPKIPGATTYHVMRAPAELGWAFPQTVADGYMHQCTTEVGTANMVRMKACGGCGCGEWSETQVMDPQSDCE